MPYYPQSVRSILFILFFKYKKPSFLKVFCISMNYF